MLKLTAEVDGKVGSYGDLMWAISGSDLGQISPIIWTPPYPYSFNINFFNIHLMFYLLECIIQFFGRQSSNRKIEGNMPGRSVVLFYFIYLFFILFYFFFHAKSS